MRIINITVLFFFISFMLSSQQLNIRNKDGSNTAITLSAVRKVTFQSGDCVVYNYQNTTQSFPLNAIRYISRSDISTSNSVNGERKLQAAMLYPNPATTNITICNASSTPEGTISIYNACGQMHSQCKTTFSQYINIDISDLEKGIYFCRLSNNSETKTLTFIKK